MAVQLDEAHAIFLGPGEGEQIAGGQSKLVVKAERGELEVFEFDCTPDFEPVPLHVHDAQTDSFYVLKGKLEFTIGDETLLAGPGTFVAAPAGVRHGFRNPGPGHARFLNIQAPAAGFVARTRAASRETED